MSLNTRKRPFTIETETVSPRFREFAKQHVADFAAARDRVANLIGPEQKQLVGIAREDLLRRFLRNLLPGSVSVDTGIIYGFEQIANSAQIDVIVWDSGRYPAVHRTDSFAIVAPESVIAAVSVKTNAGKRDLVDTVKNLASIAQLDVTFRAPDIPPILKIGVFYRTPSNPQSCLSVLADTLRAVFLDGVWMHSQLRDALEQIHPIEPSREHRSFIHRLCPRLFTSLDGKSPMSVYGGFGPPGMTEQKARAERFHRRPFLYPQRSMLTSPLEKLAYHVLEQTHEALGAKGGALVAAWGDFHPVDFYRLGDADELDEESGLACLENTDLERAP